MTSFAAKVQFAQRCQSRRNRARRSGTQAAAELHDLLGHSRLQFGGQGFNWIDELAEVYTIYPQIRHFVHQLADVVKQEYQRYSMQVHLCPLRLAFVICSAARYLRARNGRYCLDFKAGHSSSTIISLQRSS